MKDMEAKAREWLTAIYHEPANDLSTFLEALTEAHREGHAEGLGINITEAIQRAYREGRNSALHLSTVRALMNEGMEEAAKVRTEPLEEGHYGYEWYHEQGQDQMAAKILELVNEKK